MKHKATYAAVLVVLVLTWNVSKNVRQGARQLLGVRSVEQIKVKVQPETSSPKCGLSRFCPSQHFAVYVRSGAADVVGPKICFDGQIIMSHVLNNVGPGLNIVVINAAVQARHLLVFISISLKNWRVKRTARGLYRALDQVLCGPRDEFAKYEN
ncbi:protein FAM3A-like isoform X2 [Nerophis ophidion]|uniref:protein FAM3A-like isoform X2 n=1 Tax=Nerophis ophidion TaxID=159077 RepID=UPI002ADF9765|nr:protein FAM3A-like isoform X2 [Nerophis ophidion]